MNYGCLSGYGASLSQLYDDNKSLNDRALRILGYTVDGWMVRIFAAAGLDPDKPIPNERPPPAARHVSFRCE